MELINKQLGKFRLAGGSGKFYKKSLVLLLIVTSIPGIITGALVYWMAGGRLESELLKLHNYQIEQRAGNLDEQLENLELMLSHWAFDSRFDYSLSGHDFVRDFVKTRDIVNTLLVMQGSNTMIKNVNLYLQGEQPILFDPEYSSLQSGALTHIYDGLFTKKRETYWTQLSFNPSNPAQRDLTFVHLIPGGSMKPFGALLIRLDSDKVAQMLRTMTPYSDGENLLMEEGGDIYVSASGSSQDSPFVQSLRGKIEQRKEGQGSFFFDWNNKTYAVTYGHVSRIAETWMYVSASPITSITAPVVLISKIIFTVSLSAFLIAVLLAWLASKRLYSPVKRLMGNLLPGVSPFSRQEDEFTLIEREWNDLSRESKELNAKLSAQLPYVKESFLHQLVQGYLYAYSEDDLLSRMASYKWDVSGKQFVMLYVQLNGIASMEGKFSYGDEGLVTFASVNMIEELAGKYFEQSSTINFHDLGAGLLLILPANESYMDKVQPFCEELTQAVNRLLLMRVTVAVSRSIAHISDVPFAFEGVKHAASFRNFDNENQLIDMEQLNYEDSSEPPYPFTLEREFIQALRTGQEADARTLLCDFMHALSVQGAKAIDVQQGMLHLLGSVQHAILVSGIQPKRLFKGANLYEQLSQIKEPGRICDWFQARVIDPFMKELVGRSDLQVKRLIEEAMLFLQKNYMQDISLDNCADHIGTNPFFLSKSFKQVTGKNFIDYLTELRMDKAKELLRESELKINAVAEQVGYQHSYFNRIFKKLEGMTPTRYRELSRAE
ncbi:AraC family transcriptional regulator [Paenibacillus protaetiae]|uniref:AraC family transcriptional regulator n=2 Tax=Paenibacillus protaetiae TaxID=2509456 RepID=A0A4P6F4Z6_9BACL|nr:AraC family transcriptional regulator [Paenibacillus protaetiae]